MTKGSRRGGKLTFLLLISCALSTSCASTPEPKAKKKAAAAEEVIEVSAPKKETRPAAIERSLVIGVRDFEHKRLRSLAYAESDALGLHRQLSASGTRSHLLLGADATPKRVSEAMKRIATGTGNNDTVVVYFNGYIVADPRDASRVYLLGPGGKPFAPSKGGVDFAELLRLSRSGGGHWIFVLDGLRSVDGMSTQATGRRVQIALLALVEGLRNVTVLSAGPGSKEGPQWRVGEADGGGVATYHLLQALRGHADSNADSDVDLGEALRYAVLATREATGGAQVPSVVGPQDPEIVLAHLARRDPGGQTKAREAKSFSTFADFLEAHALDCHPAPSTVKSPQERIINGNIFMLRGTRAELMDKDKDQRAVIGVLGSIRDPDTATQMNMRRALGWFRKQKVDAVVVNGDLGSSEASIFNAMQTLASAGLPVFVFMGNRENVGSFNSAAAAASKRFGNIINMNLVREVDLDDLRLVAIPGYHDRAFLRTENGCLYGDTEIAQTINATRAEAGKAPVMLVAHGPPKGRGERAIDFIPAVGNVGDPRLNKLLLESQIPFGVFGHILEAGGRATNLDGTQLVGRNEARPELFLNVGGAGATPWKMNDGSWSTGMAFIVTVDGGQASYTGVNLGN